MPPAAYARHWSPEQVSSADVVLVADGEEFPAHSQVLAASSVLGHAIFGCDGGDGSTGRGPGRDEPSKTRIEAGLKGVGREDLCLLLGQLYPTDEAFAVPGVEQLGRIVKVADRLAFDQVVQKCCNTLAAPSGREALEGHLRAGGPAAVLEWLDISGRVRCEAMREALASRIAQKFEHLGGRGWREVQDRVRGDADLCWRVSQIRESKREREQKESEPDTPHIGVFQAIGFGIGVVAAVVVAWAQVIKEEEKDERDRYLQQRRRLTPSSRVFLAHQRVSPFPGK